MNGTGETKDTNDELNEIIREISIFTMPCWFEFIALLKLVFGLLLPGGLTLESTLTSKSCCNEWFCYWFIRSFMSYFLPFGVFSVHYVPVISEAEVCLLAWLFLPQSNGYSKLCEKKRLAVEPSPLTEIMAATGSPEQKKDGSVIDTDSLIAELSSVLRRKDEEVCLAKLNGNVFEMRIKEKQLSKAIRRVQSLTEKLKKENESDAATEGHRGAATVCKQQTNDFVHPSLTSAAYRQALVQHVIPE